MMLDPSLNVAKVKGYYNDFILFLFFFYFIFYILSLVPPPEKCWSNAQLCLSNSLLHWWLDALLYSLNIITNVIIKHLQLLSIIIKHYKASSSILNYHQVSSSIIKHHQELPSPCFQFHKQASSSNIYDTLWCFIML